MSCFIHRTKSPGASAVSSSTWSSASPRAHRQAAHAALHLVAAAPQPVVPLRPAGVLLPLGAAVAGMPPDRGTKLCDLGVIGCGGPASTRATGLAVEPEVAQGRRQVAA